MFEINNKKVETYKVENYTFNVVKDFYKYPDEIVNLFSIVKPRWHKHLAGFYHQGIDFKDMRHVIFTNEITPVYDFLETITGEKALDFNDGHYRKLVNTNYIKFLNHKYDNHIFYPHTDLGKTAIVYLNKEKSKGTNFTILWYKQGEEHEEHFINADQVEILHHIDSEYNKLIIWEGKGSMAWLMYGSNIYR